MFPIHHTFAPLADRTHVLQALRLIVMPWKWQNGPERETLRSELQQAFGGDVFLFASGREALCALLQAGSPADGDEVIVQGYTCTVVPNAIKAAGMTPVFCDIDPETLSLDVDEVEHAITPRTRAILCQHTFGIPAPTKALRALCNKHNILLIEDCAHVLPDSSGPEEIGTCGDALLLSFGRDKAISGVTGGAIIYKTRETRNEKRETNNEQPITDRLRTQEQQAKHLPWWTIKRLLFYPLIYAIAKPLYGIGIGKVLLALAGRTHMLVSIVTREEKAGRMPRVFHRLPNACAALALGQLRRLQSLNDHRRMLTRFYFSGGTKRGWPLLLGISPDLPLQKFPLFVPHAEKIRRELKRQNIHLYDGWTGCVICPPDADPSCFGYEDGRSPDAEMAGRQILSLPTHPTMSLRHAMKLIECLDPLLP